MKQRRPQPRSGKAQPQSTPAHQASSSADGTISQALPQRRSTYFEAVAVYEQGLEALQHHDYSRASQLFESVLAQFPDEKELLERVAVAHAQRDEHAEAVAHLERAIALNSENRALARTDPDLEPLRDDETFRAALEAPSSSVRPIDRRRSIKTRTAR